MNQAQPNSYDPSALPAGLSPDVAQQLLDQGLGNIKLKKPTRSIPRIIFDNVFNLFNLINTILGVVVLWVSLIDPIYFKNLLFMGVVVANTAIYSFQEIRAKLTIDQLAILTEPEATVRRGGENIRISVHEIVPGDILHLKAGQQVPVDGQVKLSDGLEIDEALLTGESNPVRKMAESEVLSGSVVMSGEGYVEVTKVARDTFAARIMTDASKEKRARSPLMVSLNKILKYVAMIIFPLGIVLIYYAYNSSGSAQDHLRSVVSTSGLLVSMLPEGLILLTSIALGVAVVRLGQVQTLVQTVPSVETLARVDVLCLDKTGTITTGNMTLLGLIELEQRELAVLTPGDESRGLELVLADQGIHGVETPSEDIDNALRSLSRAFPEANATQQAIAQIFTSENEIWEELGHIPFSSQRKWSGASFESHGSWYLGAAEVVLDESEREQYKVLLEEIAIAGFRVLVLAHSSELMSEQHRQERSLVEGIEAKAILVIADEIRDDVAETLAFFDRQGVDIKIISGDHPKTLEAIAKRAGIRGFAKVADMSQQPEEGDFKDLVNEHMLFGRVSPFQKRQLLKALQSQGHIVAMTGDGVNDVLALRDANCGVAMASGSEAARAVADIVLLDNQMSRMVDAVDEGRRVINNIQRVASLFLIKTTYAILFALSILPLRIDYPILPIQGSLINSLTVGIPSFVLALKPNKERVMGRFLANVMPMAWPAGVSAALMLIFLEIAQKLFQISPAAISTYGTFILISISLRALYGVSKPFDWIKRLLLVLCTVVPLAALFLFPRFLMVQLPQGNEWLIFAGLIVGALALTEVIYRISRSYPVRKLVQKILGKSREDILQEEWDRNRAARPRRLRNLRDRFQQRKKFRLQRITRRRARASERRVKPKDKH